MLLRKLITTAVLSSALITTGCLEESGEDTGIAVADFDGTWDAACSGSGSSYVSAVMTISGGTATTVLDYFTDASCTTPASPATSTVVRTHVYPGAYTTTSLGNARQVNITAQSVTLDGQEPTAEDLVGLEFIGFFDTSYDIMLTENDRLYFGDADGALDGSTAALRPSALLTEFLTRQ